MVKHRSFKHHSEVKLSFYVGLEYQREGKSLKDYSLLTLTHFVVCLQIVILLIDHLVHRSPRLYTTTNNSNDYQLRHFLKKFVSTKPFYCFPLSIILCRWLLSIHFVFQAAQQDFCYFRRREFLA